jgi:hypothetical protein
MENLKLERKLDLFNADFVKEVDNNKNEIE